MEERDQVLTEEGHARRRFLKQAATVAWASPFIVTMLSRTANAQEPIQCGTKIGGVGTIACTVTNPCGSPLGCAGNPAGAAGSACFCAEVSEPA